MATSRRTPRADFPTAIEISPPWHITVCRYGSRPDQILRLLHGEDPASRLVVVDAGYTGGCAGRACEF